jgi:hypothetical protein
VADLFAIPCFIVFAIYLWKYRLVSMKNIHTWHEIVDWIMFSFFIIAAIVDIYFSITFFG